MKKSTKKVTQLLKPYDYLIFFCLIVLSFLPVYVFSEQQNNQTGERYAVIKINGNEVGKYNLDETEDLTKTYYPNSTQYNIIEIKNGKIRVKEDNSPDQIAVRTGWIEKNGQTSICLPHKLVIEIKQYGENDYYIY